MIPDKPPAFHDLLRRIMESPQALHVLAGDWPEPPGYLHWDELQHLAPPAPLTSQQWWLGIKVHRQPQRQVIPLRDKAGNAFSFLLNNEISEALHHIDQDCAGRIAMPEGTTTRDNRARYQIASLMEEAVTSSLLEGAAVTRERAREMLRSRHSPRDKGERMILNNYRTMQHLQGLKAQPMTPALLLDLHRMISRDTLDKPDAVGRWRRDDEHIEISDEHGEVFHIPPAAKQLPQRMEELCAFANGSAPTPWLHPVVRAVLLHFWLAYDHPFYDGNGRTARALFYWSMLRSDYWLFEYISISQALLRAPRDYYRAFLHTETDDNDLNYFLLHQLRCIQTSVRDLHAYLGRKTEQRQQLQRRLRDLSGFNHRQQSLLLEALDDPHREFSFASHEQSHRIARMTARADLLALETQGLLTSRIVGRMRHFIAVPGLEALLMRHGV